MALMKEDSTGTFKAHNQLKKNTPFCEAILNFSPLR
jgi:hypothetical protein